MSEIAQSLNGLATFWMAEVRFLAMPQIFLHVQQIQIDSDSHPTIFRFSFSGYSPRYCAELQRCVEPNLNGLSTISLRCF